ncbi:capsule assembly Wzi family protein [Vibrio intestinalis]|uniref:capsule assembly Wzi family protein n=1 Tax=Vibrio intestinalis TaxID=2933291 RepID=UPI0021A5C81C|nr:capsule assembly Wzi family protein [Vibrio intestinalis]
MLVEGLKNYSRTKAFMLPLALLYFAPLHSEASPWVEANDPFLRSSILALSDASVIDGPTSLYPLRWSLLGELTAGNLSTETSYVKYMRQSSKLNRGSRRFAVYGGNEALTSLGFGEVDNDKWGAEASYAYMDNSYSFRLNTVYSDDGQNSELSWRDSYLSLNMGRLLVDIGYLPRWWGQGWQHNLVLQTEGQDLDINASVIGESQQFGVWDLTFLTSKLELGDYGYRSSTRFTNKLTSNFEYGLSYHYWFEGQHRNESNQDQFTIDARLSLPTLNETYHSIYAEWANGNDLHQEAYLVGWTGHVSWEGYSARLVLEHTSTVSDSEENSAGYSASVYAQFPNDHKLKIAAVRSEDWLDEDEIQVNVAYTLPAIEGLFHLETEIISKSNDNSDTLFWAKYEFRF